MIKLILDERIKRTRSFHNSSSFSVDLMKSWLYVDSLVEDGFDCVTPCLSITLILRKCPLEERIYPCTRHILPCNPRRPL